MTKTKKKKQNDIIYSPLQKYRQGFDFLIIKKIIIKHRVKGEKLLMEVYKLIHKRGGKNKRN